MLNILECSPIAQFAIGLDHKVTYWNRACELLTGVSAEEMLGTDNQWKPFYSQKRPVLADFIINGDFSNFKKLYKEKQIIKSEFIPHAWEATDFFESLGGKPRHVFFLAAPIFDNDGKITGVVETLQDITSKIHAENELLEREARFHALFAKSRDANLLLIDGVYVDCNEACLEMLKATRDQVVGTSPAFLSPERQPDGRLSTEAAEDNIHEVMETGSTRFEWVHQRLDGTEFWTEVVATNININGKDGLFGVWRDISERKLAEDALEEAQKELIEKAHQAGMANVATGTLHNVGNILNSVKTSAQVIADVAKASSVSGLKKANNILRENIECLDEFILHNPKGKKLMQYYLKLEEGFDLEQAKMIEYLVRLEDKVNAIDDVISAQQSYAGISSLSEECTLSEIVEDALTMQFGSTEHFNIEVIKDFQDVPNVMAQRVKLVHILINLIKNARESIIEAGTEEKNMTISINAHDNTVFVKVKDTGTGIAASNLDKIFTYGFTTKENGHGFGLHSCSNYMKEMGGNIKVESEGEGKGTTFILHFQHPDFN